MTKSTITRATAVAVAVGLLAGSAVYEGLARSRTESRGIAGESRLALAEPTSPKDVVVVVNGQEITRGDVDREIDAVLGDQLVSLTPEQRDGIRAQLGPRVTDGVIARTLLEQAVEKENVAVDQKAVASSLAEIKSSLPAGKTIDDYLRAMGTTPEAFAQKVAMNLRVEKLVEQKTGKLEPVTDAQVESFYRDHDELFRMPERAEVSHILVAVPPGADEATKAAKREQAEAMRAEIAKGDDSTFATLAGLHSDCPSKAQGGRLGMVARGDTVPAFEEAVFSQKVGEIGPVVETPFGYHIIRVDKREPAGKVSLAEARPYIEKRLTEDQRRAAFDSFVESLRASAEVVYPGTGAA